MLLQVDISFMRVGIILFVFIICYLAHGRGLIKYFLIGWENGKYLVQVVGSLGVLTGELRPSYQH